LLKFGEVVIVSKISILQVSLTVSR